MRCIKEARCKSLLMDNIKSLIEHTLTLFPDSIDISDGELRSGNGFFSKNLSDVWNKAEDKNGVAENDVFFMIWAIYGLLHRKSRENYSNSIYTVSLCDLSIAGIEKEYIQVINESKVD